MQHWIARESNRDSALSNGDTNRPDRMALVSQHLLRAARAQFDVVHVNAEFHDQASDHDPQVARFTLRPGVVNLTSAARR